MLDSQRPPRYYAVQHAVADEPNAAASTMQVAILLCGSSCRESRLALQASISSTRTIRLPAAIQLASLDERWVPCWLGRAPMTGKTRYRSYSKRTSGLIQQRAVLLSSVVLFPVPRHVLCIHCCDSNQEQCANPEPVPFVGRQARQPGESSEDRLRWRERARH